MSDIDPGARPEVIDGRRHSRHREWRLGIALLGLLGPTLIGVAVFVAMAYSPFAATPRTDPGGSNGSDSLLEALRPVFGSDCPKASVAATDVAATLQKLGYSGWTVESGSGVAPDSCVTASLDEEHHRVVVVPALSADVRSAIQEVRLASYGTCLTQPELVTKLTDALTKAGASDFAVTADTRLVAPTDRYAEVKAHVLSGCWVYSTSGLAAGGSRVFYIVGPP